MDAVVLTRAAHSRAFAAVVVVIVALCAGFYFINGNTEPLIGNKGLGLPSANMWLTMPRLSFIAAVVSGGLTMVAMSMLNTIYNVLRSMTTLFAALFAVMQLATPNITTQFYSGSLLAVAVPACMLLLFSCYKTPAASRRTFLIFFILSALSATQYCYFIYIPAFLAGLGQMRVFNSRCVIAAVMGLLTPWLLYIGYGIVDIDNIHMPKFSGIFNIIDFDDTIFLIVTLAFTAAITLLVYILNVMRTIAYNARARAFNGSFTIIGMLTAIAMCVDYNNIITYIPLLNFSAAMEMAHYFSTHRGNKSFIAIFSIIAVYVALFLCQTIF